MYLFAFFKFVFFGPIGIRIHQNNDKTWVVGLYIFLCEIKELLLSDMKTYPLVSLSVSLNVIKLFEMDIVISDSRPSKLIQPN